MAGIDTELNIIEGGIYGRDVRQAIHDGLEKTYRDASVNPIRSSGHASLDASNYQSYGLYDVDNFPLNQCIVIRNNITSSMITHLPVYGYAMNILTYTHVPDSTTGWGAVQLAIVWEKGMYYRYKRQVGGGDTSTVWNEWQALSNDDGSFIKSSNHPQVSPDNYTTVGFQSLDDMPVNSIWAFRSDLTREQFAQLPEYGVTMTVMSYGYRTDVSDGAMQIVMTYSSHVYYRIHDNNGWRPWGEVADWLDVNELREEVDVVREDLADVESLYEHVDNLAKVAVQGYGLKGSGKDVVIDNTTTNSGYLVQIKPNTTYSVIYSKGDSTYFKCVTFTYEVDDMKRYYELGYSVKANGSVFNTNTKNDHSTFTTGENDSSLVVYGNRSTVERTQVLEGEFSSFQSENYIPSQKLDVYSKEKIHDIVKDNKISLIPCCYGNDEILLSFDRGALKIINSYKFMLINGRDTKLNNYVLFIEPFEINVQKYSIVYVNKSEIPEDGNILPDLIRTTLYYSTTKPFNLKDAIPLFVVSKNKAYSTFGIEVKDVNRLAWFGDSISMLRQIPHDVGDKIGAFVNDCSIAGSVMYKNTVANIKYEVFGFNELTKSIVANDYSTQNGVASQMTSDSNDNFNTLKSIDFTQIDTIVGLYGTNDYNASVCTIEEFKQGMAAAITRMLTAFPNVKMYFISPPYRTNGTNKNSQGKTLYDYVIAEKEVCESLNIPFYDLYHGCNINSFNADYYLVDGLHVNKNGNDLLTDKCSRFIASN